MKTTTLQQELITDPETAVGREYLLFLDYDRNPRILTTQQYAQKFSPFQGYFGPYHATISKQILDIPLFLGGVEDTTCSAQPSATTVPPFESHYTNWKGQTSLRRIVPEKVWYGSTAWHPEPQWLLTAWDTEKNERRDFALADFHRAESIKN